MVWSAAARVRSLLSRVCERALLLLALAAVVAASPRAPCAHRPSCPDGGLVTVSTPMGDVMGFVKAEVNGETQQFWNLPFALPPVGDLRWRPPQPLTKFPSSPLDATNTTNRPCGESTGEDCLYLTISVPSASTPAPPSGWPVLIYYYGGAFTGSNIMDASGVVAYSQSFIYVSANYRLGLLGYFPQADLTAENAARGFSSSGNQGVQDQTASARWVHDYIRHFGGDPARVTIAGESAGSASVCMQLLSPAASGLFSQAVLESGACSLPVAIGGTLKQREADVGAVITRNSGCDSRPPGAARLACLRALSFRQINALQATLPSKPGIWGLNFSPIWDGVVLPGPADALLASDRFHHVPLLIGTNRGETGFELFGQGPRHAYNYSRADINAQIGYYSSDPALTAEIVAFYSDPSSYPLAANVDRAYIESSTACIFLCPTRTLARAAARVGQPVWLWMNDFLDAGSFRWLNVTVHTQEMAHVYRTQWAGAVDDALILSAQMQLQWLRFVTRGSPNLPMAGEERWMRFFPNDPLPLWPQYSVLNNLTLNYRNYPETKTVNATHFAVVKDIDGGQCDMWDRAVTPDWYNATGPHRTTPLRPDVLAYAQA